MPREKKKLKTIVKEKENMILQLIEKNNIMRNEKGRITEEMNLFIKRLEEEKMELSANKCHIEEELNTFAKEKTIVVGKVSELEIQLLQAATIAEEKRGKISCIDDELVRVEYSNKSIV